MLQFEVSLVSMTYRHIYGMACDIRIWTKVYNIGEKFCEKKSIIYDNSHLIIIEE